MANLYAAAPTDTFSNGRGATLSGPSYSDTAVNFPVVNVYGIPGKSKAQLSDLALKSMFTASKGVARLTTDDKSAPVAAINLYNFANLTVTESNKASKSSIAKSIDYVLKMLK